MKLLYVFFIFTFLFGGTLHAQGSNGYTGYQGYSKYSGYKGYKKAVNFVTNNYKFATKFSNVRDYIIEQSELNNVPSDLALEIAQSESGLDPNAESPTTAVGVYQFVESTWRITMDRMGLPQYQDLINRYNAKLNIDAAIWLMAPPRYEYEHWFPYSGHQWKDTYYKYFK